MRILFHLGHPAHFHLFKNTIHSLEYKGHKCDILIKKKDILEDLLKEHDLQFENILPKGRKDDKFSIAIGQLKQDYNILKFASKNIPDLLIGSTAAVSHVGKLLGIPSINLSEDDVDVIPTFAKMTYPWSSTILVPSVCRMGRWYNKSVFYNGYHELSYLHPSIFNPNERVAQKYIDTSNPFYIMRFAKLGAHHDTGISGINNHLALQVIDILKMRGNIIVTSERELIPEIEKYRVNIKASDMHHIMAFSSLFIGDSQTMAAESGVLGIPFIRYNDFVGRISYLDELENKYKLGIGIKTANSSQLLETVQNIIRDDKYRDIYKSRRDKMLSEKINLTPFLVWFFENYPKSVQKMKENPNFQYTFK